MENLKVIFNGHPDRNSDNAKRAFFAFSIPLMVGVGGSITATVIKPEIFSEPPLLLIIVPAILGAFEGLRQIRVAISKEYQKGLNYSNLPAKDVSRMEHYLSGLRSDPDSCQTYESVINNPDLEKEAKGREIEWFIKLMHRMNSIHTGHDKPNKHERILKK